MKIFQSNEAVNIATILTNLNIVYETMTDFNTDPESIIRICEELAGIGILKKLDEIVKRYSWYIKQRLKGNAEKVSV